MAETLKTLHSIKMLFHFSVLNPSLSSFSSTSNISLRMSSRQTNTPLQLCSNNNTSVNTLKLCPSVSPSRGEELRSIWRAAWPPSRRQTSGTGRRRWRWGWRTAGWRCWWCPSGGRWSTWLWRWLGIVSTRWPGLRTIWGEREYNGRYYREDRKENLTGK